MRMLIVSPFLPYPIDSGGATRLFNLIKEDSKYFSLHFLFINYGGQKIDLEECQSALPGVVFHQVLTKSSKVKQLIYFFLSLLGCQFFCYRDIKRTINNIAVDNKIDIVQFEFSQMIKYYDRRLNTKKVLVIQEIVFRSLWRQLSIKSGFKDKFFNFFRFLFFRREEISALQSFDTVIVMSNEDRSYLAKFSKRENIEVIPNGVNTNSFSFPQDIRPSRQLYFIGWFKNLQNVDAMNFFLDELLPSCLSQDINFKMKIIGRDASDDLKRRFANAGFSYIEYLPDNMLSSLANSVLIVPLRFGGGTRLKILEAMSMGNPVVSSLIGAEGLDLVDGQNVLLYKDKDEFVQKLSDLFSSDELWKNIVKSARDKVESTYDWRIIVNNSLAIYNRLISNKK